jgi:hypothetical protein
VTCVDFSGWMTRTFTLRRAIYVTRINPAGVLCYQRTKGKDWSHLSRKDRPNKRRGMLGNRRGGAGRLDNDLSGSHATVPLVVDFHLHHDKSSSQSRLFFLLRLLRDERKLRRCTAYQRQPTVFLLPCWC